MSGSSNYSSPNLVIPYTVPNNVPPELVPLFKPIYITFQNLVQSLITYCGIASRSPGAVLSSNNDPTACLASNVHRFYTQATEAIAYGAAINLWSSGGTLSVRNANATDGTKQADGFCSELAGIPAGGIGEVILDDGVNSGLSGLVPGTRYYLSTTSGQFTATAPTATGNLQQSLGIALTATTLKFWTGTQIQH